MFGGGGGGGGCLSPACMTTILKLPAPPWKSWSHHSSVSEVVDYSCPSQQLLLAPCVFCVAQLSWGSEAAAHCALHISLRELNPLCRTLIWDLGTAHVPKHAYGGWETCGCRF